MSCTKFRGAICVAGLAAIALLIGCGQKPPQEATMQVDDVAPPNKQRYDHLPDERVGNPDRLACVRKNKAAWKKYMAPEMMAIGGSVFNGISSMQINWWLADWSPPAQVQRALHGVATEGPVPKFQVPAYPDRGRDPYLVPQPGDLVASLKAGEPERPSRPTFRLGLDLETINLDAITSAIRRQGWVMSEFANYKANDGVLFNDNLGFGGAAVDDVLYGDAEHYRKRMKAARRATVFEPDRDRFWGKVTRSRSYAEIMEHAKFVQDLFEDPEDLPKTVASMKTIFFALNSRFVLNPTNDDCIDHLTALDQVLIRKPKRLLVGLGSNSGLFTFLYSGQPVDKICGDVNFTWGKDVREWKRYVAIAHTAGDEYINHMEKLLRVLAEEGDGIENIYVMGQMKPSMVANLRPAPEKGQPAADGTLAPGQLEPAPKGYHDKYTLAFAPEGSRRWVSGWEVWQADELNKNVNKRLEDEVAKYHALSKARNPNGPNFIFVSLDPIADKYDYTHNNTVMRWGFLLHTEKMDDDGPQVVIRDPELLGDKTIRLDNRALRFSPGYEHGKGGNPIGQHVLQGGFFSVDNLHPSVVGYSILAQRLLDEITMNEHLNLLPGAQASISPQAAFTRRTMGNVLRRPDRGLAVREQLLQAMFDLGANKPLDCRGMKGDLR